MTKKLVWVTNVWSDPIPDSFGTVEEQKKWRSQFIKGDPLATKLESVASLKTMGVIGLYKEVEE